MRTTVDIDPDVFAAVKERARSERKSAGSIISGLVRQALHQPAKTDEQKFMKKDGFIVLAGRGDLITYEHVKKLLDEEDV